MDNTNQKPKRPPGHARLISGKCIACGGRCESECRVHAISTDEKGEPHIALELCTGCRRCIRVCPASALEIFFTPEEQKILDELGKPQPDRQSAETEEDDSAPVDVKTRLAAYRGVWIFIEQTDGKAEEVSWELLGKGAELAKALDVELSSLVLGHNVAGLCRESFEYGAVKSYLVDDPVLEHYRTKPYYQSICTLVNKYKPEIILMGATPLGRDLAGAVATTLETGLTADCTGLTIDENRLLLQTRPAFGGNIMATICTEFHRPQMASVRPHVMPKPQRKNGATGEVIQEQLKLNESDFRVKLLEIINDRKSEGGIDIASAEVLVAGGRGMMSAENFSILQELADELGGTIAVTRACVEAGWISVDRQVGQTGKTVRPKIYFACGISGAIQHTVGMQDSEVIIAINRDPEAPIFEVANYGIVGDLFQVVPAITRYIRELRAQNQKRKQNTE